MLTQSEWLQLGLGGAALFVLIIFVIAQYRVVMRVVEPLRDIAGALERLRMELSGVRERVSRIEGKLDTHFDWTPVETPRAPPEGYYARHNRPKTEPGGKR